MAFSQQRLGWIESTHYEKLFNNLKANIDAYLTEGPDREFYTKHDSIHCQNVEKMIKALVGRSTVVFSDLEKFLLSCSAWTHDLGMSKELADDYFKDKFPNDDPLIHSQKRRREHHNISCWYLEQKSESIFKPLPQEPDGQSFHVGKLVRAISLINQYHRKIERLERCPEHRSLKGEVVRLRLLAALLRLADTLHLDSSRYDAHEYRMVQIGSFDRVSRLHWLKSFFVTNVFLDNEKLSIIITLDLPDPYMFEDFDASDFYSPTNYSEETERRVERLKKGIRNLEYIISSDVSEELASVNEVFSRNTMPSYVNVEVETVFNRGYRMQDYDEMKEVINELGITFSPNTSNIIRRALQSLMALANKTYADDQDFIRQFDQVREHLKSIKIARPCHVGLGKIVDFMIELKTHMEDNQSSNKREEYTRRLKNLVKEIKKSRKEAFEKIESQLEKIIPPLTQNIILIGFSSTVMSLLKKIKTTEKFQKKDGKINVFVLEAATKKRLMHNNLLEYNDGINYALEISELKIFSLYILPDAGLASMLSIRNHPCGDDCKLEENITPENTVMLIGVNGVDTITGNCAHSSGHLSAVLIAHAFDIPIHVVADFFKIGEIKWNLSAPRNTAWLTTQFIFTDELTHRKVKQRNYREDEIPIKYISKLFTDVGVFETEEDIGKCVEAQEKHQELENIVKDG